MTTPKAEGTSERVCPDCGVERTDYEGPNGAYLPTCPNCGSRCPPATAMHRTNDEAETWRHELYAAGWRTLRTATLWQAPSGALYLGPYGAWKRMKAGAR